MLDEKHSVLHSVRVMAKNNKPAKQNKTWRPTPEDARLMRELQAKTGIVAETEILRMGLRALAQAQGIGQ